MPNNYFQFKQFTVYQDKCSMKVCTDACVFGAYIAKEMEGLAIHRVLDIGAGTGLLSLMLAQKNTASFEAIEIEEAAAKQSAENFSLSPWSERLQLINMDATKFKSSAKYDCVISNPPFYEDDLRSADASKNNAKHDTALTLELLLQTVNNNLSKTGIFAVLLPYHRVNYFIASAELTGLYLTKQLLLRHSNRHPFFRGVLIFQKQQTTTVLASLSIKENNIYTPEFIDLVKDYYLHL